MRTAWLMSCLTLACTAAAAAPETRFGNCTEFVGVAPVPLAAAQAMLPSRFTLVAAGGVAQLVVRVADCRAVQVGRLPARPGRVAQIGLMILSPDGTATDPATAINNYTLSYATNSAALVVALRGAGIPAEYDSALAVEAHAGTGGSEFYAGVASDLGASPAWFLHGTVQEPTVATRFLANWWRQADGRAVKMATDIPAISFDFSSQVSFTSSRASAAGRLLGANRLAQFPLSFRGAFAAGTMVIGTAP